MKKYIKPTIVKVEIDNEAFLAGSDMSVLSAGNGHDALSKRKSLHGDEWDFDDAEE